MFINSDNVAVGPESLTDAIGSLSQSLNFLKQQPIGVHVFSIAKDDNSFVPGAYTKINCTETFSTGVEEGLKFDPDTSQFYVRGDVSKLIIIDQLELYLQGSTMPDTTFPASPRVYIRPYLYNKSDPDTEVAHTSHTMNFSFPQQAANDTMHVLGYDAWSPSYENLKFEQRLYISGINDNISVNSNLSSNIVILTLWDGMQS